MKILIMMRHAFFSFKFIYLLQSVILIPDHFELLIIIDKIHTSISDKFIQLFNLFTLRKISNSNRRAHRVFLEAAHS